MKKAIKNFLNITRTGGKNDDIRTYITENINEAVKEDVFYELKISEICEIIKNSKIEKSEIIEMLVENTSNAKGAESYILLDFIDPKIFAKDDCIRIISKFKRSMLCRKIGEINENENNAQKTDFQHMYEECKAKNESLEKEIKKLKESMILPPPLPNDRSRDLRRNLFRFAGTEKKNIKCVAVGDFSIGKTSLLISFTTSTFPGEYTPTIFDTYSANIMIENLPSVNLQLCDTAGQENYQKFRSLSYPHTDVFLICFSLVNPKSLENAKNVWVNEIREFCPDKPFILVGLKSDLRDEFESRADELREQHMEPIPYCKGEEVSKKIHASAYVECSALKSSNLDRVFETAIKLVLKPAQTNPSMPMSSSTSSLKKWFFSQKYYALNK